METKHTPTPAAYELREGFSTGDENTLCWYVDRAWNGETVAEFWNEQTAKDFITSRNAHDDLVALARAVKAKAQQDELSTHVEVTFDPIDAALLLNMAEAALAMGGAA